jgi:hypothetical protein
MFLLKKFTRYVCLSLFACALLSWPAYSQQDNSSSSSSQSQSNDGTIEGTIISSSRVTFVVRSEDNQFHLFTFDQNTNKPRVLTAGMRVRVDSDQGEETGARHATDVTVVSQSSGADTGGGSAGSANASARRAAPLPPQVRNVESQIQREARRWRLGARAGIGLDPELVMFGIHSQMGPVFNRNFFFRPSADFEWGEITDMMAFNLEGVYRMNTTIRRAGEWSPYLGAGPSLNFIHQSFQTKPGQGRSIDWGNFDYQTGLNVLMGVQNRRGMFFEVKTSLYSKPAPILRLIVGKNF